MLISRSIAKQLTTYKYLSFNRRFLQANNTKIEELEAWQFPYTNEWNYFIHSANISEISDQNLIKYEMIQNPNFNKLESSYIQTENLYKYQDMDIFSDSQHIIAIDSYLQHLRKIMDRDFAIKGNIRKEHLYFDKNNIPKHPVDIDGDFNPNPFEEDIMRDIRYKIYYEKGNGIIPAKDNEKDKQIQKQIYEEYKKYNLEKYEDDEIEFYNLYNPLCDSIWRKLNDKQQAILMLESMIKTDTIKRYNLSCMNNGDDEPTGNYRENVAEFISKFAEYFGDDDNWQFYTTSELDPLDALCRDEMICAINKSMDKIFGFYCFYYRCYG